VVATRVTVIDDDADVLDLFRDILQDAGYVVETHSDALPGVDELILSKPGLIIVDMLLDPHREQLTGLQLIHSARSSEELRDVPIIVCSADMPELEAAWPELAVRGDIHKLGKPFDLDTFELVMSMALGRPAMEIGFGGTRIADVRRTEGEDRTEQEG
jgi:CheY-like chemotaxis protein